MQGQSPKGKKKKKVVLQILENSQEKPVIESLKEETLAQVFSCEF